MFCATNSVPLLLPGISSQRDLQTSMGEVEFSRAFLRLGQVSRCGDAGVATVPAVVSSTCISFADQGCIYMADEGQPWGSYDVSIKHSSARLSFSLTLLGFCDQKNLSTG